MIRRLILAALPAACLAFSGAAQAQQTGIYNVSGTNPDGSMYEGIVMLQQAGIVSWRATWSLQGERIEGIGMSSSGVFSVTYQLGDRTGMGIYAVNADGSMFGQWTVLGSSGIGTEMLTPQAPGQQPPGGLPPAAPQRR